LLETLTTWLLLDFLELTGDDLLLLSFILKEGVDDDNKVEAAVVGSIVVVSLVV